MKIKKFGKRCLAILGIVCLLLGMEGGLEQERIEAASVNTQNYVVVLDPGHDASHTGNTKCGLREEALNLKIAQACKKELETYPGVTVYMTRTGSGCPFPGVSTSNDLQNRVKYASSVKADLYVSLHCNSSEDSSIRGVEVYYPNANYRQDLNINGKKLSTSILSELTALGLQNRGIRIRNSSEYRYSDGSVADYYAVIRESKKVGITGIIVEHAYQSNLQDVNTFLYGDAKLEKLGMADAKGIASYLGLSKLLTSYKGVDYSAVYDPDYYYTHQKDVAAAYGYNKTKLIQHFVQHGMTEGRQAKEDFNVYSYRGRYVDLEKAYGTDLPRYYFHYMNQGKKERRDASRVDMLYVVDYVIDGISVFTEKVQFGCSVKPIDYKENGKSAIWDLQSDCVTSDIVINGRWGYMHEGVDYSPIFDAEYYLSKHADLAEYGMDGEKAFNHFVNTGMTEGLQAKESFEVYSYKGRYVDLQEAFGNNLKRYYIHYLNNGIKEGRTAAPVEDKYQVTFVSMGEVVDVQEVSFGRGAKAPAIPANGGEYSWDVRFDCIVKDTVVTAKWISVYNGVDYSLIFDAGYYLNNYPDLKEAFGNDAQKALKHFVNNGMSEGRQAIGTFCVQTYKGRYMDLQRAFGNNLKSYYIHYMNNGMREGRTAV